MTAIQERNPKMPHALALQVPMDGWQKLTPRDWPELHKSPKRVIAQWVSGQSELTLYEDGDVEVVGYAPIDLLPFVSAEWHESLRGRIA